MMRAKDKQMSEYNNKTYEAPSVSSEILWRKELKPIGLVA